MSTIVSVTFAIECLGNREIEAFGSKDRPMEWGIEWSRDR